MSTPSYTVFPVYPYRIVFKVVFHLLFSDVLLEGSVIIVIRIKEKSIVWFIGTTMN